MKHTEISLGFWKSQMDYRAGCNWMSASFDIRNDTLIAAHRFSTLMACEIDQGSVNKQDHWYRDFLDSRPAIRIDSDHLVLANDPTIMYFRDRALDEPDTPLIDSVWAMDSCIPYGHCGEWSSVNRPWFKLQEDGRVSSFDGCYTGEGTFQVSYAKPTFGTVRFGDFTYTNTDCREPIAFIPGFEPDRFFEPILTGKADFRIQQNVLLFSTDDETGIYAAAH